MKILIAEDEKVARTVLAKILQALPQHTTTLAEDGAVAWGFLDDPGRNFDVLFLDLDMPNVGGFELLERIRESPFLKSLQVVLCTASHDRDTVLKAVGFGVKHYIVKPCTEAVVIAKLQQLQSNPLPRR